MKQLILIRHAKSSWKNLGMRDFDRPLNDRGKRDAPRMAIYLKERQLIPDLIISSSAKRALSTAKKMAKVLNYPKTQIIPAKSFYTFDTGEPILTYLATLANSHQRVMIFGHNPTFTHLAYTLTGHYFENVPTCGIVAIQFDTDSWQDIGIHNGQLDFYIFPKMLVSNQ